MRGTASEPQAAGLQGGAGFEPGGGKGTIRSIILSRFEQHYLENNARAIVYSSYARDFFIVEESLEGGFTARALGESLFTQSDDLEETKRNTLDAVSCHFDRDAPHLIRLPIVREETLQNA